MPKHQRRSTNLVKIYSSKYSRNSIPLHHTLHLMDHLEQLIPVAAVAAVQMQVVLAVTVDQVLLLLIMIMMHLSMHLTT